MKKHLLKTMLIATGLIVGAASSWADTKEISSSGHIAIVGTKTYETISLDKLFLNSYATFGGASAVSFTLDDSFDATKVKKATLQLYVISKPNKNRSCTINFFGLSEFPTPSTTFKKSDDGKAIVYSYGGNNTKRYVFTGTPFTTINHSAYTNYSLKQNTYNDIDVTDYIKGLQDAKSGNDIYIGMSINDAAVETEMGGYGNTYAPKLVIEYSDVVLYTATFKENTNLDPNIKVFSDDAYSKEVNPSILTANTKYYFIASLAGYDDYKGEFTVGTENPTVNFIMTKKERFKYSVCLQDNNGNTLKTILDDNDAYSGKVISYSYPKYLTDDDGKVTYTCNETTFSNSITPTATGTIAIKYTSCKGEAYYFEGEDLIKGTNMESSNYSSGIAVRGFTDNDLFTIKNAGNYKLTYTICSHNLNAARTVAIYLNDTEKSSTEVQWSVNNINKTGLLTLNDIAANANDVIKIKASDTNIILDYILLEKVSEAPAVGSEEYATYVTTSAVVIPENVKVYAVKAGTTGITKTQVAAGTIVKKGTALLINASEGSYAFTVSTEEGTEPADNDLKAGADAAVEGLVYCLTKNSEGKIGFAKVQSNLEIPSGKAYLIVPQDASANFFALDDTVTAIQSIEAAPAADNAYYTLQGVKVEKPTKGIYVHNGKKVVIK